MYVMKRQVIAQRGIATLAALALILWAVGAHMFTHTAEAANLTSVSDTLSDTAPDSVSDHTIAFTTPNGMVTGGTFTVTFPGGFDASSIVLGDIDLSVGGSDQTLNAAAGAGEWGVSGLGTNTITFETPTDGGVASSTAIIVYIGQNGPNAGGTENQITNPSATTSYEISIGGTMQDSGATRVAIIENVLVTADVQSTLTFTISGVAGGATVNGSPTTTADASTNTTLPFGTLSAGTSKTLAQDLTVTTNAANGFSVTVYQDNNIESSTGADIDGFIDGSYENSPTAWTGPTPNINNEDTWGHWGLTSEDSDLNGDEFGSDLWVAASTTPREIFSHDDPADGTTADIGSTRVGYQIQISSLQEAGDDYNTTLTYVATPTF